MSITVQQILVDAKKLVGRLKDHDNFADSVIAQAHNVKKNVDAMKQVNFVFRLIVLFSKITCKLNLKLQLSLSCSLISVPRRY